MSAKKKLKVGLNEIPQNIFRVLFSLERWICFYFFLWSPTRNINLAKYACWILCNGIPLCLQKGLSSSLSFWNLTPRINQFANDILIIILLLSFPKRANYSNLHKIIYVIIFSKMNKFTCSYCLFYFSREKLKYKR